MDKPHIFSFALPAHKLTNWSGEPVGYDNPLAVEVAKPQMGTVEGNVAPAPRAAP